MPLEARAELRAEEGRPGSVQEARGKVVADAHAGPRASEYTITIPETGVAAVDGTSITDAALERKLAAAVKRDPAFKVRIWHAAKQQARGTAIVELAKRAGVTAIEVGDAATLVLVIAANGTFSLGARVIADAELDKELAVIAKQTQKLALAADSSTPALVVEKLVQRAKAAGFTEVVFVK